MTKEKHSKAFSIKDRFRSFKYAFNGLAVFLKTEHNAQIHVAIAILVVVAGYFFEIEKWEWVSVFLAIGLVFITELLNTSLEYMADAVSPGLNEKIGLTKDLAAGAVLVAAIIALIIGCLVFIPRVI